MTDRPKSVAMQPCGECGMPCDPADYHPYAACLMFRACHNSEVVLANLEAVRGTPPPAVAREQDTALIAEHVQALDFLAGLHPCLTIDGPPMAVAERIFDAVMGERSELLEQIANQERNLEWMRNHLAKRTKESP